MFIYNKYQYNRLKNKEALINRSYPGFSLVKIFGLYRINVFYKILEILIFKRFDSYLKNTKGVIHIGASDGYERNVYKKYNVKNVIWIEPNPFMFKILKKNIKSYSNHKPFNYLISDTDNKKYKFKITSNYGQNSTISEFTDVYKSLYPDTKIVKTINIKSITLKKFVNKEKIDLKNFEVLIVDTEGAELKVLKGCGSLLNKFKFIRVETSEFRMFKNYPLLYQISEYLKKFNFKELRRIETDQSNYFQKAFDVLYTKQ